MYLRIPFLGQPRIRRDGAAVDLAGYRPLALLAYLIVTKKAHTRQHLIDLLFDGHFASKTCPGSKWDMDKLRSEL